MKILSRADFMELPAGTIYAKGQPWCFGNINIKGDTIYTPKPIDWCYLDPCWIEAHDSGEAGDRLDEMAATGASYPMQESFGRDGCFDDDDLFLVFERDDLVSLLDHVSNALTVTK